MKENIFSHGRERFRSAAAAVTKQQRVSSVTFSNEVIFSHLGVTLDSWSNHQGQRWQRSKQIVTKY
jgi:hypothetical protein